jgi:hypothetical protein
MKNIHVLPTDKPSRLHFDDKLFLSTKHQLSSSINSIVEGRNIYITSDEYIGLSYYLDGNLVRKGVVDDKDYWEVRKDYKKIILTTDQDLIKDGIQAIDDEFLEWFVKNPSCESVGVSEHLDGGFSYGYKIIITKEEPKQKLINGAIGINGISDTGLRGIRLDIPKQETLEEAAEKFRSENPGTMQGGNNTKILNTFKSGAKWQQEPEQFFSDDRVKTLEKSIEYLLKRQEKMYSEEEVLNFTQTMIMQYKFGNTNIEQLDLLKETLQQFKHK